ncbi:MAG: Dyp-type peroxidase [Candidatus Nanopelagicales bacterium]
MAGREISRRRLLAAAGGGAVVGGLVTASGISLTGDPQAVANPIGVATEPFYGAHQAGIVTAAQAHTRVVSFTIRPGVSKSVLGALLLKWTESAAAMTAAQAPALDTSPELFANGPARLTVTVAFGPGFFDRPGMARLRPDGLADLPAFHKDDLQPQWTGGDLFIQVSGDDPLVVSHATRSLITQGSQVAKAQWVQRGFLRSHGVSPDAAATQRNLMGNMDGTGNPQPTDGDFAEVVWSGTAMPQWARGGSFVILRRIRMLLDHWETHSREQQDEVIGRRKDSGAPLTGMVERDQPDFSAQNADGSLVIPAAAHIRLAHHTSTRGAKILRRSYSYDDGYRPDGQPDAGLMFIAWQADPRTGFVPIQNRLDVGDAMNHMTSAEGSAIALAPPGCQPGGYLGQELFDS